MLLIASFPRYVLECIGIVFIALFAIIALLINNNLIDFIPILGALALGAQEFYHYYNRYTLLGLVFKDMELLHLMY